MDADLLLHTSFMLVLLRSAANGRWVVRGARRGVSAAVTARRELRAVGSGWLGCATAEILVLS